MITLSCYLHCTHITYTESRGELLIQWSDAQSAQLCVSPSGLREISVEVPRVKWQDIGGQNEVRTLLSNRF
jgi:SpoVK/Ycf46/Vps4 family AAA+-type ATPase